MGKGDIKTKKGKINNHSFGNSRKHKSPKDTSASNPPKAPKGSSTATPIAPAAAAAVPPAPSS